MSGLQAERFETGSGIASYHDRLTGTEVRKLAASEYGISRKSLLLLMLIAVAWLATRPYRGVFHDGRFYAIEALNFLLPGRFGSDPYFAFGSQGDFTVFTRLYAPLIAWLGLPTAALVSTVAGQALWICALFRLALGLVRERTIMLFTVGAAIALPATYGVFTYGEAWVTPRIFVEALTLFAIGSLVRRQYGRALLLIVMAAPVHPLMTLPGLALVLVYLALERPIWWAVLGAGTVAGFGLAFAHVQPFANLLVFYDAQWFAVLKYRDPFCLITEWGTILDLQTVSTLVLTLMGFFAADQHSRRLLITALVVGLGGVAVTFVGGDLLHNVFVVEVQPWRSMWLLALIANLHAVPAFLRLLREGQRLSLARTMFVGAAIQLVLSEFMPPFIFIAAPLMVMAAFVSTWQLHTGRDLPAPTRFVRISLVQAAWISIFVACYGFKILLAVAPIEFAIRATTCALLFASVVAMIVVTMPDERLTRWFNAAMPLLAGALLAGAIWAWDARPAWTKFIESPAPPPASLANLFPQNASVYWEDGLELLWFRLNRPSYFSCDQGTGSIFYRRTAMEYWKRAQSFWLLRTLDFGVSATCSVLDQAEKLESTAADLRAVCIDEPSLDYLVMTRPIDGARVRRVWESPAPLIGTRIVDGEPRSFKTSSFYVYSCADRR